MMRSTKAFTAKQWHQQRGDIHSILRKVCRCKEQALYRETECEPYGRRSRPEEQKQCRPENEMHFGDTDRVMRQEFEERKARRSQSRGRSGSAKIPYGQRMLTAPYGRHRIARR